MFQGRELNSKPKQHEYNYAVFIYTTGTVHTKNEKVSVQVPLHDIQLFLFNQHMFNHPLVNVSFVQSLISSITQWSHVQLQVCSTLGYFNWILCFKIFTLFEQTLFVMLLI
jgi:hypothetical protein